MKVSSPITFYLKVKLLSFFLLELVSSKSSRNKAKINKPAVVLGVTKNKTFVSKNKKNKIFVTANN